jgi:hypothetical protein
MDGTQSKSELSLRNFVGMKENNYGNMMDDVPMSVRV